MRPFLIISISILLFNHVGFYFVMEFQQQHLKETMKEKIVAGLKEEELISLNYTDNSKDIFTEDDDADEISYNGKMYDVVRKNEVNGKTILHCISDEKETELVEKYARLLKDHEGTEKKQKRDSGQPNILYWSDIAASKIFYPSGICIAQINNTGILAKGSCNKHFPPPKA